MATPPTRSSAFQVPIVARIQIQTAAYGGALAIAYGTNRVAVNLIWYRDFKAIPQYAEQQGGKGGDRNPYTPSSYLYTASVMLAVCEGPIANVIRVWRDKQRTSLVGSGFTLLVGNRTQSAWSYLTTKYPTEAIGYAGTALIAKTAYDLGDSGSLGNHSLEVKGFYPDVVDPRFGAAFDANPSDVIVDLLTNAFYGAGWPSGRIGDLVTGAGSFKTYCTAAGFFLSPVIIEQKPTLEHLKVLLEATNSDALWSQGVLKILPYGDVAIGGYAPNTTPIYDLGVDDFLVSGPNDDHVAIERSTQADTFNSFPVEYKDRLLDYNTTVIEDPDPVDVEAFGLRKAQVTALHCITRPEVALQISRIKAQRSIYERNLYRFRLGWKYILLEPMDLVTLTDPALGLDHKVVRIREIEENDDGDLTVVASEWPFGIAAATAYTPQPGPASGTDANVDPGNANAPVIFEFPPLMTGGVPTMGIGTSGGADWGGAQVWISFDGSTYSLVGSINAPARHGVLNGALAQSLATNNDVTNTGHIDLSASHGTLVGCSAQDKDDLVTACYVGRAAGAAGAVLSFQNATLTSTDNYDISIMRRGAYGTTRANHASGSRFIRLDESVFRYAIPVSRIGTLIYVKLQSFNAYGGGLQDLSGVTPTTYTPVAAALTPPAPAAVTIAVTSTAPSPVAGQRRHRIWDEDNGFGFTGGGEIVMKKNTFVTVGWTFNALYPTTLLSRFRIVIYTGTDPNDESKYLGPPIDVAAGITSLVASYSTPQLASGSVSAAVQAMYFGDHYESAWATSAGTIVINPDTLAVGTTSDYTEDGSGNPTAGAMLRPGEAIPLKLGPAGCQIGTQILDEPVLRATNAIRRNAANDKYWYGGNCDASVRTGAPDIGRLTVTRREWSTAGTRGRLELKLQPNSATDNIEAMRYAKLEWFRQSAAGTTATLTALDTTYVQLPDRIFFAPGTDSNAANAVFISAVLHDAGITSGFPACKVTIYNAFGPSDTHCFYAAAANADGADLTDNGTAWPAGITGGSGGGSGGGGDPGGYCVAPETPIMLASGRHVPARALRVRDLVWTLPEGGREWGAYPVVSIETAEADVYALQMTDGRTITVSEGHRLLSGAKWKPVQTLQHGDVIDGLIPGVVGAVAPGGRSNVLRITIERASTYLTDRLLSHNAKPL